MTRPCRIACRLLPDQGRRPRVVYLTGWQMGIGATWTRRMDAPEVLTGTEQDARRWAEELRREGINQAQIVEG